MDSAQPGLYGALLALLAVVAYANAWPNTLVFDDVHFLVPELFEGLGWSGVAQFFLEDAWATRGAESGLYRPLFLCILVAESLLFRDWPAGYHLVNIALHTVVTLLVFRLVRELLVAAGSTTPWTAQAAFLAAAVFAVHPVHAETVNSVFNGSELWVSIGVVGGLSWLLAAVDSQPVKAWTGLGLIYLLAMLIRESAVVLPVLAAGVAWIYRPGSPGERLRRVAPVLALAVPLAIYLGLRMAALGGTGPAVVEPLPNSATLAAPSEESAAPTEEFTAPTEEFTAPTEEFTAPLQYDWSQLVPLAQAWLHGLRLWLWPHPLSIIHRVGYIPVWLAIVPQLMLAGMALYLLRQERPNVATGLAFFYVTILPATFYVGKIGGAANLQERFLYLPSVGLTLILAAAVLWFRSRHGSRAAALITLVLVLALTPLSWVRNNDWSSNVDLFEAEYERGSRDLYPLVQLVSAHYTALNFPRAARICDEVADQMRWSIPLAEQCGLIYQQLWRVADAERTFRMVIEISPAKASAHKNLAVLYLRHGRREEAVRHFEKSIEVESLPAMKEIRQAHMLFELYPHNRSRLREARDHVRRALELQPRLIPAVQLEALIAERLGSPQE